MNDSGKSDRPVVPKKRPNKVEAQAPAAEGVEERGLTKGNSGEQTRFWTQGQIDLPHALDRIRTAAKEDKERKFTALWHHVYNVNRLRQAYHALKRNAAPGIDGQTWHDYGRDMEANLKSLSERLRKGSYRAKAVRRTHIPKADGRLRPIGITALEDKIAQKATSDVLGAIYEVDFLDFSHGFRPGRGQHNALDAVTVAIERQKISWIVDADIQGFFDTIGHDWMMKFLGHRIGDQRVLRHIKKWLDAGVWEDESWRPVEDGVPQGGSICPLLANIYLHYALDLWVNQRRKSDCGGEVIIVRYADDFILGFQYEREARQFMEALRERLGVFHLTLHPDKTRLIEFGRFAAANRHKGGMGKPETFNFLGFTHLCGKTRRGKFCVKRKTMTKRMRAKLKSLGEELRARRHDPIPETGKWLKSVLHGHYQYYGVPRNSESMSCFREEVMRRWRNVLKRRSGKSAMPWDRMRRHIQRWLPRPKITHPYPHQRLIVGT